MEELQYIELLINDLEESKGICTTGLSGCIPITEELTILKKIYGKISKPKIVEKITTIEKIINPKGEKIGLKEIIKLIKKNNRLKSYNSSIKKSNKKIESIKLKIESTNKLMDKIKENNTEYEKQINMIEKEIETSKSEIKCLLKKCLNFGVESVQ